MEKNNEVIKRIRNNESIFVADNGEKLSINNSRLSSSGSTTNKEESILNGLNSGILAKEGSRIDIRNSTITTIGKGADAVFSCGENSLIDIDNIVIKTKGEYSHGLSASLRGTVNVHDISVTTEGNNSASIAAYTENGIVNVANSSGICEGENSPCIYSKGNVTMNDSNLKSEKSEAAIVEGSSIIMNNTSLSGKANNGIVLFQREDKNEKMRKCIFTSNLGSITSGEGAMFYITNTEAIVSLFNTKLNMSRADVLVNACKGKWGVEGNNGATATLVGNHQTLRGDILCDELSSVQLSLKAYTYYTGTIDSKHTGNVGINLDSTSVWTVSGTSYISYINNENKELKNIIDNGYNIFYDPENEKNKWLEGKEITLSGGGKLIPA